MPLRRLIGLLTLLPLLAGPLRADDNNKDSWTDDYATGGKLYNQNRLSEPFDNFEKAQQRKLNNGKDPDTYLLEIRKQVAAQKQKQKDAQDALNFNGDNPEGALSITYVDKDDLKVILKTKFLFDENTAALRTNSLDIINKLSSLLQSKSMAHIELSLVDELDDAPTAKDVDAARAEVIFALLNFKKITPNS